jgi:hypothetical protein
MPNLGQDLAFKATFADLEKQKGNNSESFKNLVSVYNKLPPEQQQEVDEKMEGTSFGKTVQAVNAGIDPAVFFAWKDRLSSYKKDMKDNDANAKLRDDLYNDSALNAPHKNTLDKLHVNDNTIIPRDKNVDYSSGSTFIVSQMSDTAQKGYSQYIKPQNIDAGLYQTVYEFYNDAKSDKDAKGKEIYGRTKQDKVFKYIKALSLTPKQKDALLLSLGYSKDTVYSAPW